MKAAIATLTSLAVLGLSASPTSAGDREWATAGKVLTGLVAGTVLVKAFEPVPVYQSAYYAAPVYAAPVYSAPVVQTPPPPPVIVQTPVAQPAPVVVYQQPVIVQPAPVYVQTVPVYVAPRPLLSFSFGFGRYHCAPPVYRICR